jgi:hypothetical protein
MLLLLLLSRCANEQNQKKYILEITWLVLLFEYEYSAKVSGMESDEYLTLLGAFNYDDDADSLYDIEAC